MLALAVEAILKRWRRGWRAWGNRKHCPIVWDLEWSNTKIMKNAYTVT